MELMALVFSNMELLTPDEIVRLSPPERLALIAQLWDSLEHEQLPLTSPQREELERRLICHSIKTVVKGSRGLR